MAESLPKLLLGLIVVSLAGVSLLLTVALVYGLYFLLSLPLRRRERDRYFIDLLSFGLARGERPENAIVKLAQAGDRTLGVRFLLLGAYMEKGMRLSEALRLVSGLVSPRVTAILAAGESVGDIQRVLPACRQSLAPATSQVTGATNYLLILPLLLGPAGGMLGFMSVVIVPKFQAIFSDLVGYPFSPLFQFLHDNRFFVGALQSVFSLGFVALIVGYAVGPRLRGVSPVVSSIDNVLPWRRWRLRRDFSALLAVLLDAEMPEAEAVTLAAQCTDNDVFIGCATRVVERLRAGVALPEALTAFDETGEFQWRLSNAAHGHGGFRAALAGWHEALEAKAYQAEQATAQLITTGLVVLNGVIVGVIAVAVFQSLTTIITEMPLW
jgi:type IV pilus assembly protein PilC